MPSFHVPAAKWVEMPNERLRALLLE